MVGSVERIPLEMSVFSSTMWERRSLVEVTVNNPLECDRSLIRVVYLRVLAT